MLIAMARWPALLVALIRRRLDKRRERQSHRVFAQVQRTLQASLAAHERERIVVGWPSALKHVSGPLYVARALFYSRRSGGSSRRAVSVKVVDTLWRRALGIAPRISVIERGSRAGGGAPGHVELSERVAMGVDTLCELGWRGSEGRPAV